MARENSVQIAYIEWTSTTFGDAAAALRATRLSGTEIALTWDTTSTATVSCSSPTIHPRPTPTPLPAPLSSIPTKLRFLDPRGSSESTPSLSGSPTVTASPSDTSKYLPHAGDPFDAGSADRIMMPA